MPYDPTLPQPGTEIDAHQMRAQLNGLKNLIDAVSGVTSAVVDAVSTLPPGSPAAVTVSVSGTVLHLSFSIPQGQPGSDGAPGTNGTNGANGTNGIDGGPGPQGPPGEVTQSALDNALAGVLNVSSNNSNAVSTLNQPADSSYNQTQMQDVLGKLDELINALRR